MRHAFVSFQHGFLRSAENIYLHNLLVLFENMLSFMILFSGIYVIGKCYTYLWQMLLPLYEVVIIS